MIQTGLGSKNEMKQNGKAGAIPNKEGKTQPHLLRASSSWWWKKMHISNSMNADWSGWPLTCEMDGAKAVPG